MNEAKYSTETVIQIWNDKTGERVEVGPDRDGLDLIEIRSYADDGTMGRELTLTQEQALLVSDAIQKLLKADTRPIINRERWARVFGRQYIDHPEDRTNYLLDVYEQLKTGK